MKYLFHADGKLPNLALMRLSAHFRGRGHAVRLVRVARTGRGGSASFAVPKRALLDPVGDNYGSSIFEFSAAERAAVEAEWGFVQWGGTGVRVESSLAEVDAAVDWDAVAPDYSLYPEYRWSLGFTQRGCRLKCDFCLTPDSLVLTADGPKPIAAVVVGDRVLTHSGRYQRVTEVMTRDYDGDVLELRSGALSELFPTTVTPEHPIWTRHVSYRSGGQRLTSFAWKDAATIRARHPYRSGETFAFPRPVDECPAPATAPDAPWLPVNADAMTLLGWFVAEGYITSGPGRGYYRTTFCLGFSEREMGYAEEIVAAAKRIGLRACIYRPKIGIRVVIDNVRLARWLVTQFGTGASTKKLPHWLRALPRDLLAPFVAAWAHGDGWSHVKKGTPTTKVTTVSPALALALHEIVLKLGHLSTINRHQTSGVIQGRVVDVKPAFSVIFHPPRAAKQSVASDGKYVYRAARESVRKHYAGPVFNLEVENDHSYCTPAFVAHNCVVPAKEGRPAVVGSIADIWRGEGHPRKVVLLDNDFFGQPPDAWRARVDELRAGRFRVSLCQGINVRMVSEEAAAALASLEYRDNAFRVRRLYTAWDSLGDERVFKRGVERLRAAGIPHKHLMVYMLCGYAPGETLEEVLHRFREIVALGAKPYPMVFDKKARPDLCRLQRWVTTGLYRAVPRFEDYDPKRRRTRSPARAATAAPATTRDEETPMTTTTTTNVPTSPETAPAAPAPAAAPPPPYVMYLVAGRATWWLRVTRGGNEALRTSQATDHDQALLAGVLKAVDVANGQPFELVTGSVLLEGVLAPRHLHAALVQAAVGLDGDGDGDGALREVRVALATSKGRVRLARTADERHGLAVAAGTAPPRAAAAAAAAKGGAK